MTINTQSADLSWLQHLESMTTRHSPFVEEVSLQQRQSHNRVCSDLSALLKLQLPSLWSFD